MKAIISLHLSYVILIHPINISLPKIDVLLDERLDKRELWL